MTAVPAVTAQSGMAQLADLYRQQVAGTGLHTPGVDGAGNRLAGGAQSLAAQSRGADFASAIGSGLNQVEALDRTASDKAVQAATGDLNDIHDYTIAATEAQTSVELTTTLRNKALDSFQEIMRMPL